MSLNLKTTFVCLISEIDILIGKEVELQEMIKKDSEFTSNDIKNDIAHIISELESTKNTFNDIENTFNSIEKYKNI